MKLIVALCALAVAQTAAWECVDYCEGTIDKYAANDFADRSCSWISACATLSKTYTTCSSLYEGVCNTRTAVTKGVASRPSCSNQFTDAEASEIVTTALAELNTLRSAHSAGSLAEDSTLTGLAQQWSNYQATIGDMIHSNDVKTELDMAADGTTLIRDSGVGENLYISMKSTWSASAKASIGVNSMNSWYNEKHCMDWSDFSLVSNCVDPDTQKTVTAVGHFTSMVWDTTTTFGLGVAFDSDCSWAYITAHFGAPSGTDAPNLSGTYSSHVHAS